MTLKKIIGYFLMALPFWFIIAAGFMKGGLAGAFIAIGITGIGLVVASLVILGIEMTS